MRALLILLLLTSTSLLAEPALSDEYKALRIKITKEVSIPYDECLAKESKIKHEMAVQECESQGEGINVGGGCEHVAGLNTNYHNVVSYNCEELKPTIEQYKQALLQAAEKQGVQKYK